MLIRKFCYCHHRFEQCRVKRLISLPLWSYLVMASIPWKPRSIVIKSTSVFGQLHLLWAVRLIPWCHHPYGQSHMYLTLILSLSILTGTSSLLSLGHTFNYISYWLYQVDCKSCEYLLPYSDYLLYSWACLTWKYIKSSIFTGIKRQRSRMMRQHWEMEERKIGFLLLVRETMYLKRMILD